MISNTNGMLQFSNRTVFRQTSNVRLVLLLTSRRDRMLLVGEFIPRCFRIPLTRQGRCRFAGYCSHQTGQHVLSNVIPVSFRSSRGQVCFFARARNTRFLPLDFPRYIAWSATSRSSCFDFVSSGYEAYPRQAVNFMEYPCSERKL